MKHIDVSIVILSYNTCELTLACLGSLEKTSWGAVTKEIFVVDNASDDQTAQEVKKQYPHVRVIKNSTNFGFAKGNNIGIEKTSGQYVLLLNSDTEVSPDAISSMIAFMDAHPKAGAATCKLVLPDGSMDPASHRGFPTPWNGLTYYLSLERLFPKSILFGGYHQGYKRLDVPHEVDAISGAFFLVRRKTLDQVGLLDESFFMYAEDIDLAYRIKEAGWQMWFVPSVLVLHRKKQSGRDNKTKSRRIQTHTYFLSNNRLFYTKHYEKKYSSFVTCLVYAFFDIQIWIVKTFGVIIP